MYNEKEKMAFGKSSRDTQPWVQTHYGYANIIVGAFIALCVKMLFRKHKYNLFEITVLHCFVMIREMLLLPAETLFVKILNEQLYKTILAVIAFAYPTWVTGQFFDKTKVVSSVNWPKNKQCETDLTLSKIIKTGYSSGMVESTPLSINSRWSAIKFTHPKNGKVYNNSHAELRSRTTNR